MASYADDIRKIAKEKSLKGGLGDLADRDPIPGNVTPFINEMFPPASSGVAPEDKVPEANDPTDPNTFNKGDGSGGTNGGVGGGDKSKNGPQDADDLVDDKAGPTLPDSAIAGDFSGGSLNKITGLQDCDTGKCVTVHLDGQFNTPDGWNSPDDAPIDDTYIPGKYWLINTYYTATPSEYAATPGEAADLWAANVNANDPSKELINLYIELQGNGFYRNYYSYINLPNPGRVTTYAPIQAGFCSGAVTSYCPAEPPTLKEWPQDGCYDVAMIDGQMKTNSYDSEAPSSFTDSPTSANKFCTTGGKEVMIRAASNGGTMIYPVGSGGAPVGTVKTYNSDGTLRSAGDATQSNIDSELPR